MPFFNTVYVVARGGTGERKYEFKYGAMYNMQYVLYNIKNKIIHKTIFYATKYSISLI